VIRKTRLEAYTLFETTDEVTYDEAIEVLDAFYGEGPTANVLWDLRKAKIAKNLSKEEIQKILRFIEAHADEREGGKTAIVVSEDADYGVAHIFLGYTMSLPITVQIFRDMAEATTWITQGI
jgi:hypothetical protein